MRAKTKPMSYALRKLARRSYSIQEMKEALFKVDYEKCEVEEVISQLINKGYLNDRIFAQRLYDYYIQHKLCGPLLLPLKLKSKGIQGDLIDELMVDYSSEKELEIIQILFGKLLKKNKNSNQDLLIRQLQRKGFTCSNINKYLRLNWTDNEFNVKRP
jgi:SOS response regulatory protein OraA/RecX